MAVPTSTATKLDPARTAKPVARSRPSWELLPDEPIGPSRGGGSGRNLRKVALSGVVLLGGAWGLWGEPSRWREWMPAGFLDQMPALLNRSAGRIEVPPVASPRQEPAANRIAAEGPAAGEPTTHELRAGAALPTTEPSPSAPPNVLNRPADAAEGPTPATAAGAVYAAPQTGADPLGRRAEAAGLHPEISRALLQRLSDADFRNAGLAIQKAVTETADDAVLIWPLQRKPELAHFQVHFVPGAGPACRRYVVTVTKDAWSTTALPMERCGIRAAPHPSRTK